MSSPFKIWVKYGEGQPAEIIFDRGNVHALKKAIKKELTHDLDKTAVHRIILRKHSDETDLEPDAMVDSSFQNTAKNPLQVIVPEEKHEEQGN